MPLLEWEKTLTCPYNPSHQITIEKLQFHLVKCRRNHPNTDVQICAFNTSHHVKAASMEQHLATCPDRKHVEQDRYVPRRAQSPAPRPRPSPRPLPSPRPRPLEATEDWEAETVASSYDPSARAKASQVVRKLEGATPSQRKAFRAEERWRLERLREGSNASSRSSTTSSDAATVVPRAPLRRPVLDAIARAPLAVLRRPGLAPRTSSVAPPFSHFPPPSAALATLAISPQDEQAAPLARLRRPVGFEPVTKAEGGGGKGRGRQVKPKAA